MREINEMQIESSERMREKDRRNESEIKKARKRKRAQAAYIPSGVKKASRPLPELV